MRVFLEILHVVCFVLWYFRNSADLQIFNLNSLTILRHCIVYVQVSIKSCLLISEIISEKFSKLWHLEPKHMPEIVQKWGEFRKEWHIVFKSYDSKCSSSNSWVRNKEVELFMNLHSSDISAFHGCFSWNSSRPPVTAFIRTNLDCSGKFIHIQIYKASMTTSK